MKTWRISFQMTQQLVEAFAAVTGDYNLLHMNQEEARSYAYRQRVVHGMLPVSALVLLEPFSNQVMIRKIHGRFVYPVYLEDTVTIELKQEQKDAAIDGQRFLFNIKASSMAEPVTFGEVILGVVTKRSSNPKMTASKEKCFLDHPVEENVLELEQMAKGHTEEIAFNTRLNTFMLWTKELRKCVTGKKSKSPDLVLSPEMIPVMLCSTMVGMRLPGRRATFLDFSLEFTQPLKGNAPYVLKAGVDFISVSTRIVVEKIEILNQLKGKISVKMDEPTKSLPSFKELSHQKIDDSLKGKVVIITGASRGIGATTARLFASQGAQVVVNYLASKTEALKVVEDIETHGARAIAVKADVSKREQVKAMVQEAVSAFGTVDILVNNAVSDYLAVPFQSLTWEKVQRDMDVIVQGAFHCCQEVIPHMIKKGGGRIVNVVTIATEIPPVGHAKYVMAKSALIGLSRSLAVELAGHNILVNMVMPSMVETDLSKTIPSAVRERMRSSSPLGRHPTTVDVACAIVMLAGANSSYTTGQKVFVTGGLPPFG